ncbi:MAG: Gfo/Idh/MocA family oxidoreductase [Candidatus Sumerlaeota bacterium]|nr:Gfo/Idh/MocA family oxidoreductase [Candidatus Sumerlaeota bacterium]
MPPKLRVGVIGCGGIAKSVHLPSLHDIEECELVAACDIIEERAVTQAQRFSIPKTYVLFREMLAKEKLDAVFALVEPCSLFHVVNECLRQGLHVFMEKPPGITSFQARSLARAAQKAGRILQVGFNRRHIPLVEEVLKIMRQATTISQVEGRFMKQGSAAFDKGGLQSLESDVIHAIDLVRWIAQSEPVAVATVAGQYNEPFVNAWNSVARFENGVTGVIKSNYQIGGRIHDFEIHGPGASAFINLGFGKQDCEARILFGKGKAGYSLAATGAAPVNIQRIDGKELAGSDQFYRFYGFYQEDVHFLQCVRENKPPLNTIDEAVKTYRYVDMIEANVI